MPIKDYWISISQGGKRGGRKLVVYDFASYAIKLCYEDTYYTATCICILTAQVFCTKRAEINLSLKLCTILHGTEL